MAVNKDIADLLRVYCDVNAPEMLDVLRERIAAGQLPAAYLDALRTALDQAIEERSMTPAEYKSLTRDNEYTTSDEVANQLCEVRDVLFGRQPAL